MKQRDLIDYITLALAAWGAGLSSLLAVRMQIVDRPRLRFHSWLEVRKISNTPISHAYVVMIEVVNLGHRPVQISARVYQRDSASHRVLDEEPLRIEPIIALPLTVAEGGTVRFPVFSAVDSRPPEHGMQFGFRAAGRSYLAPITDKERIVG